jgi:hypothetical protein
VSMDGRRQGRNLGSARLLDKISIMLSNFHALVVELQQSCDQFAACG